jgi:hypothetical protein
LSALCFSRYFGFIGLVAAIAAIVDKLESMAFPIGPSLRHLDCPNQLLSQNTSGAISFKTISLNEWESYPAKPGCDVQPRDTPAREEQR